MPGVGTDAPHAAELHDGGMALLLWLILLVLAWPVALLAALLYPVVWLLMLPFRIIGISVNGVLEAVRAIVMLPARLLGGRPRR